jgi:hypothetical protein
MNLNDFLLLTVIKSFGTMLKMCGQDFEQRAYAKRLLAVLRWLYKSRPEGAPIWETMMIGVRACLNGDLQTMMVVGIAVMDMSNALRAEVDEHSRKAAAILN